MHFYLTNGIVHKQQPSVFLSIKTFDLVMSWYIRSTNLKHYTVSFLFVSYIETNKQTNKMAMQKLFFVFLLILSSNNISCYSSSFVSLKETSYTNFPKYLGRSLKASQTTFNVISYGAKGDGTTDDTKVHII